MDKWRKAVGLIHQNSFQVSGCDNLQQGAGDLSGKYEPIQKGALPGTVPGFLRNCCIGTEVGRFADRDKRALRNRSNCAHDLFLSEGLYTGTTEISQYPARLILAWNRFECGVHFCSDQIESHIANCRNFVYRYRLVVYHESL